MPGISIVIACRDEADTLWFTLHSLQMHTRGSFVERDGMEIVVADNDPGAKTCGRTVQEVCAAFAKARFPVRYLAAGEVKSVFYPRNQGAAAAQGEHLIFLDSHVLLTPYTIEALHRLFLNRSGLPTHALNPDLYLAHAEQKAGSWWPQWQQWLARRSGRPGAAPSIGAPDKGYSTLADAPGHHVLMR